MSLKHRYLNGYIPYYVLDKKVLLFIKGLSFPLTYKLNKNMYKYIYLLCAPFFLFFFFFLRTRSYYVARLA